MFSQKFAGIKYKYYLYSFFSGLVFYTAVLVPFYTDWGHISQTQIQFLQAWLMFWAFILEVPTGLIADRFGRKFSVLLGCFSSFVSFLIYGLFPNFSIFLLAEFLAALGLALISGAGEALLYDSLKSEGKESEYKNIYGKSFSILQVTTILSAILGSIFVSYLGLNWGMLLSSITIAISGLFILLTKEPNYKNVNTTKSENPIKLSLNGFNKVLKNKLLMTLILNGILVYTAVYFFIWLYQPVLKSIAFPIIYYGIVRALFSLSGIFFNANIERTEKLFRGLNSFLKWTAYIIILSMLILAFFQNLYVLFIALFLIGGLGQARFTVINSSLNERIPSDQRATILSSISMINRVILIVLNPFIGFLTDNSINFAFLALAIIVFAASVLLPVNVSENSEII